MKIVLLSIVKNESKIIQRCLNSVKDIVDAYCISDTGSTDTTLEILNTFLESRTGIVVQQEWKNFGYNRTLNFQTAQDYVKNTLGWDLKDTYALTLDADMVFHQDRLKLLKLKDEAYSIFQRNGGVEYPNIRLMRLDVNWVSAGVTHEVWTGGMTVILPKKICYIQDVNDGGAKSDKYTRDLKLLQDAIESEPTNARYVFYLAQTYRDLNDTDNAIQWYKKRIDMTGWYEEVWYSMFMIGKLLLFNKQDEKEGEQWLLKTHSLNPRRAEPMYYLTKYFREKNNPYKAMTYCAAGRVIRESDSQLFNEKPIYEYLFDLEATILLYYTDPDHKVGLIESMKYLLTHTEHTDVVNSNLIHYIDIIPGSISPFSIFHDMLGFDYHPSSVSVCDKVYNVRFVNYSINQKNGQYMMKDGDYSAQHPVRTKNLCISENKLIPITGETPTKETIIQGLEDLRLYKNANNVLLFLASSAEYADGIQIVQGTYNVSDGKVENYKVIKSPTGSLVEKNWLPISGTNDIIYRWSPFEIGSIINDKLVIHTSYQTPAFFQQLRGSAIPIRIGNELWTLTHFVRPTAPRTYLHCFVALDAKTYKPTRMSLPFVFRGKTIEYCLGVEPISETEIKCLVSTMDDNPIEIMFNHDALHWMPIKATLISREDVQEVSLPLGVSVPQTMSPEKMEDLIPAIPVPYSRSETYTS